MKKTKFEKTKLAFHPTTIRVLQTTDLNEVIGGRKSTADCDRTTRSDDCGGNNTGLLGTCL